MNVSNKSEVSTKMPSDKKEPVGIYRQKPTGTRGSRYEVELKRVSKDGKHVRWKTTSVEDVSDAVKLEIAKKYVRWIIEIYPGLTKGLKADNYKEDPEVVSAFNIDERTCYRTATFIRERDDPFAEKVAKKRAPGCRGTLLPPECGVTEDMIPKYVYYVPESDSRGDGFMIDRHPVLIKGGKRVWRTTMSKNVPTKEKFIQALEKLALLDEES